MGTTSYNLISTAAFNTSGKYRRDMYFDNHFALAAGDAGGLYSCVSSLPDNYVICARTWFELFRIVSRCVGELYPRNRGLY